MKIVIGIVLAVIIVLLLFLGSLAIGATDNKVM